MSIGTEGSGGKQGAPVDPEPGGGPVHAAALGEGRDGAEKARIEELEAKVAELEAALAASRAEAAGAALRTEIEHELVSAGAIDLEITVPLVERIVEEMGEPDVGKAVREVRTNKGFLFRSPGGVKSESMAGEAARGGVGLEDLASDARSSGDRGDLLRYLRARRG